MSRSDRHSHGPWANPPRKPEPGFPALYFIFAFLVGALVALIAGTILTKAIANAAHYTVQGGVAW